MLSWVVFGGDVLVCAGGTRWNPGGRRGWSKVVTRPGKRLQFARNMAQSEIVDLPMRNGGFP